jgi:hypothetical protein
MRKNEHPSCSCRACKRGKGTIFGHYLIKQVNRKIRKAYRQLLRRGDDAEVSVRTPYLD